GACSWALGIRTDTAPSRGRDTPPSPNERRSSPVGGAFVPHGLGSALEEPDEPRLVEDPEPELDRLVVLGPGVLADDDVVGPLRHAARGLAAAHEDRLLGAVAREPLERAGDDHGEALERAGHGLVALVRHAHTRGGPAVDDLA